MNATSQAHFLAKKDGFSGVFERRIRADRARPWLTRARRTAMDGFVSLEFPTTRHEDWRYTNLSPLLETPLEMPSREPGTPKYAPDAGAFLLSQPSWPRMVFVDGCLSKELSSLAVLPEGLTVSGLTGAGAVVPEHAEHFFSSLISPYRNPFEALNTALFEDGSVVWIAEGAQIPVPLHILYLSTRSGALVQPRNLIIAERASRISVLESYAGMGAESSLTNAVTEIVAQDEAVVEHCKLQEEGLRGYHMATLSARVERNARLSSFSLVSGGRFTRYNQSVVSDGEGAECELNGFYAVQQDQHVDHHTLVDHVRPHGSSGQLYKGILAGRATAVFNGKVIVRPGAVGTSAHQTNKNLLLSSEALVNTIPQLEILCNDVKCTHGAAIGQLDEDALFYLKTRGLGEEAARDLLIYGFAYEVLSRLHIEAVRNAKVGELEEKFHADRNKARKEAAAHGTF